jgi:ethanolamine transporter EutH
MWNIRHIDIMGQIIILLTGVFGVVILFKERLRK